MPLPSDISNLTLWFRAYDLVNLVDGTAIDGNWSSAVGTCTATQGTAGDRPTKQTVNGKPVVRFDGNTDKLALGGDALTATQNVAGFTIFLRLTSSGTGTDCQFAVSVGTSTSLRASIRRISGVWQGGGRILDTDGFGSAGTTAADLVYPHTLAAVFDCTNADLFMFVDGAAAGSNTSYATAGNTSNTASQVARIGAQSDDINHAEMDLYEVIVYSRALNNTERQTVEAYLNPPTAWRVEARNNIRVI